jgi:exopolyphosphatase/guanosine-5'-triphosphate,3'-diphosphate pyrophosphatase
VPTSPADRAVRVAAVDCGTNSVRLLVADLHRATGEQHDVERQLRIVRLGEGVDARGRLAPAATARLLDVCGHYADVVSNLGVAHVRFCATSAARDAGVEEPLRHAVRDLLGVEVEVLSGESEALLTATGALRGVRGLALAAPQLVADIGGGSTELAAASSGVVGAVHSLPVGSVRLTERLLPSARAEPAQLQEVRNTVDAALRTAWPAGHPSDRPASLVVVGGTAVTVAGLVLGVGRQELPGVHRAELTLDDVLGACDRLATASTPERAALPCMLPGRADVIGAGALVLERIVTAVRPGLASDTLVVSTHDILDGIAWSVLS